MNQQEIDEVSKALRKQGLTWNQTNFAVALVRNMQDKEREACAKTCAEYIDPVWRNFPHYQVAMELADEIRARSNVK